MISRGSRFSFLAIAVAMLLPACGGGGGGGKSAQPAVEPRTMVPPEVDLARRVAETQLASGFWDFQHPWYATIPYANPGFQNVTGVTVDGMLNALQCDRADNGVLDTVWFAPLTLAKAKDALVEFCDNFVTSAGPRPSVANFVFLGRYREVIGLSAAEEATLTAALNLRLSQDDATNGTDGTVVVDGWLNLVTAGRAGTPGILGWDAGFMVEVCLLWNLPAADLAYAVNFVKALPIDTSVDYGLDSAAHVLEVLNLEGIMDTSLNAALLAAIQGEANGDGSYSDNPESIFQATAYVLLALKRVNHPDVPLIQDWLTDRIALGGYVYDPDTDVETYETSGEILRALLTETGGKLVP